LAEHEKVAKRLRMVDSVAARGCHRSTELGFHAKFEVRLAIRLRRGLAGRDSGFNRHFLSGIFVTAAGHQQQCARQQPEYFLGFHVHSLYESGD
jgi:hypothetical protein